MAPIILAFSALTAFIGMAQAAPSISKRDLLLQCGSSYYDPTQYTCYSNSLCPIINGEPTELCGTACYSTYMYSCTNGTLSTLPAISGPFTLTARNPTAPFDGQTIAAAGNHFYIGGNTSSYCPIDSEASSICAILPGNTTVLSAGYMAVEVPGGQITYWQDNGALTFSQAHSAATYNLSAYGSSVYQDGGYYGPRNEQLIACPAEGVWQVFAQLAGLVFASDCVGFYAVVHGVPEGMIGAWEYV